MKHNNSYQNNNVNESEKNVILLDWLVDKKRQNKPVNEDFEIVGEWLDKKSPKLNNWS